MLRASISKLVMGAAILMSAPFSLSATASADTTLLSLINPGSLTQAYSFSFDAADTTTTLTFGGYQIPAWETVDSITFRLNGGGDNLIQAIWNPGVGNSPFALATRDSSAVPELLFGGMTIGHYDTYGQTISTISGDSYTLSFTFSNNPGGPAAYSGSAGFLVSVKTGGQVPTGGGSSSSTGVPEPATWALSLLGFAALGYAGQKRKRGKSASFDA
jgi:hypothetical protein